MVRVHFTKRELTEMALGERHNEGNFYDILIKHLDPVLADTIFAGKAVSGKPLAHKESTRKYLARYNYPGQPLRRTGKGLDSLFWRITKTKLWLKGAEYLKHTYKGEALDIVTDKVEQALDAAINEYLEYVYQQNAQSFTREKQIAINVNRKPRV